MVEVLNKNIQYIRYLTFHEKGKSHLFPYFEYGYLLSCANIFLWFSVRIIDLDFSSILNLTSSDKENNFAFSLSIHILSLVDTGRNLQGKEGIW